MSILIPKGIKKGRLLKTTKDQKEKLRQKILETARSYFKLHGRTGSATEAIMAQAGVTKGALYSHFESKEDLFCQAVSHDLTQLSEKIDERVETEGPLALKHLIEAHLSENTLEKIGESCVLSSLSSDMNRCGPADRKRFAEQLNIQYRQFSDALKFHFPESSSAKRLEMAHVIYATLVGAVSTARLQVDRNSALNVLKANRKALLHAYTTASK